MGDIINFEEAKKRTYWNRQLYDYELEIEKIYNKREKKAAKVLIPGLVLGALLTLGSYVTSEFYEQEINPMRNSSVVSLEARLSKNLKAAKKLRAQAGSVEYYLPYESNYLQGSEFDKIRKDNQQNLYALDGLIKDLESKLGRVREDPVFREYSSNNESVSRACNYGKFAGMIIGLGSFIGMIVSSGLNKQMRKRAIKAAKS